MDYKINELKESYLPYTDKLINPELNETIIKVKEHCLSLLYKMDTGKLTPSSIPLFILVNEALTTTNYIPSTFTEQLSTRDFKDRALRMYEEVSEDSPEEQQIFARVFDVVEDAFGVLYAAPSKEEQMKIKENMDNFLGLWL